MPTLTTKRALVNYSPTSPNNPLSTLTATDVLNAYTDLSALNTAVETNTTNIATNAADIELALILQLQRGS